MGILTSSKSFLLFFFVSVLTCSAYSQTPNDSVFAKLISTIQNKEQYVRQKEERITAFKKSVSVPLSPLQEYRYNAGLYKEYQKFKLDSAAYYVKKNLAIAESLNETDLTDAARLQLAGLYSSSGLFRESEEILKSIDKKRLPKQLWADYYDTYIRFFEHYSTNSYNDSYLQQISAFRDSLLNVLDTFSVKYQVSRAEKYIAENQPDSAEKDLLNLIRSVKEDNPEYAMIAYLLGNIYVGKQKRELERQFFALSAIADLKNAIKDNASILHLATVFYESGDVDKAYLFTKSAIEDAIFCKVQFRTRQMSELYSIINSAYLDKEEKRKSQLQLYLILISILSIFLVVSILYVYKQMKSVSRIKEQLSRANEKLVELNNDITQTNDRLKESNVRLSDSNLIKEEYIAHFFDLCSTYINKLEDYRKSLNKKATGNRLDELFKMLKSTTVVDNEVDELYRTFDNIFLNLYPTFIEEFNALLLPDERAVLKQGELLNTELRIFALIRLGITDSVKIAAFLRYSLSTIYNYRTKARNKAAVCRDEFEENVMKIGTMSLKQH